MTEYWKTDDYCISKEKMIPTIIKDHMNVLHAEELLVNKPACVSFQTTHCTEFLQKGAFIVLDFGKELCGGIRIVTRETTDTAKFRITFGESLSEAYTSIGEKNATNDHSPRDIIVDVSAMSDLTFGQTGFRFVRIELISENCVLIRNIFAVNNLPVFPREAIISTSDSELNKIIETAAYTLKLNLQNGYIWDGIKRDRLVWCGDLHQEIITSLYLFGDNQNITNSLSFLKAETPKTEWINTIPSYSAWWIINLCDYCQLSGNTKYFEDNYDYAESILKHFSEKIDETGEMHFEESGGDMPYFLDWPTFETEDAKIGTAVLIILAARKYLFMKKSSICEILLLRLSHYLDMPCVSKQVRAFQILAGRNTIGENEFLDRNGASGFSTFMAYYILSAYVQAEGQNTLSLIKEYFGGMLSRGATTFWEDFNIDWLKGSGRIDTLPEPGQKDIHGDFGAYCYQGFRHSLCHGWASGVISFIIECIIGLNLENGGLKYSVSPRPLGIEKIYALIPIKEKWLEIKIIDDNVSVKEFSQ